MSCSISSFVAKPVWVLHTLPSRLAGIQQKPLEVDLLRNGLRRSGSARPREADEPQDYTARGAADSLVHFPFSFGLAGRPETSAQPVAARRSRGRRRNVKIAVKEIRPARVHLAAPESAGMPSEPGVELGSVGSEPAATS